MKKLAMPSAAAAMLAAGLATAPSAAQGPTGACCRDTGCAIMTQEACIAAGGTYHGHKTTCAQANRPPATVFEEPLPDAGELPATAAMAAGSGPLLAIRGSFHHFTDTDMYRIGICDPANFHAEMSFRAGYVAEMFLFDLSEVGIAGCYGFGGPPAITSQFMAGRPAGEYYLAVSSFYKQPRSGSQQPLWQMHYDNIERAPDGLGALSPISHWDVSGGAGGDYTIILSGACFISPVCYANCDGSTTEPILNVADFSCFLSKFAAGDPYANCDGSTTPPVLNVADFSCFLGEFAAGCQ
jgi:hypothetical protein